MHILLLICLSLHVRFSCASPGPHESMSFDGMAARHSSACNALRLVVEQNATRRGVLGEDCILITTPHATAVSGGWCLASLTGAGWFRSVAMNILVELTLAITPELGDAPLIMSSNSGGSMFSVRFFSFHDSSSSSQWTYPCFLLATSFYEACFFHQEFGSVSGECDVSQFNTMFTILTLIYQPVTNKYGGPNGVLYSYLAVYYPFCSDVPIAGSTNFIKYWHRYGFWSASFQKHVNWGMAVSQVGIDKSLVVSLKAYMPRGLYAITSNEWFSNDTIYKVASFSANTMTIFNMLPFAFEALAENPIYTIVHLVHATLAFLQVRRLMASYQIVYTNKAPHCGNGCPTMDGAATDNGPMTQGISVTSKEPEHLRVHQLSLVGPISTLISIKYLLGQGPMGLASIGGLNVCPSTEPGVCKVISHIRVLLLSILPSDDRGSYNRLASQYETWRPTHQVFSSYCGDPIMFDIFAGMCSVESLCHLWADIIPGVATGIRFMVSTLVLVMSMVWLSPNPLSSRYVQEFIPAKMIQIPYFSNMMSWFPEYSGVAEQKGGIAFTKPAGHSLLDLLTWLSTRLLNNMIIVFQYSRMVYNGVKLRCGRQIYRDASMFNADNLKLNAL